jgi:hypothetical protein
MPHLRQLDLRETAVRSLAPLGAIGRLEFLALDARAEGDWCNEVARVRSLRRLMLDAGGGAGVEVDLSAFAGRRLTIGLLGGVRPAGTAALGRGVRIIDHERRRAQ